MRESRSSQLVSSSTFDLQRWRVRHWVGHGVGMVALVLAVGLSVVEHRGKVSAQGETRGARRELVDAWREVEEVRRAKAAVEVKAKDEATDLGQRLAKEGEERRRSEREAGEARTQLWAMWGRAQSYRSQWEAAQKDCMNAVAEATEKMAVVQKRNTELESVVGTLEQARDARQQRVQVLEARLDRLTNPGLIEKRTPQGKVLAADPNWGFLVVNVGDKQGVRPNGMLVVARDGNAIGKVKVTSVERDQAVAEMVPGTFGRGAGVRRGDVVVGE